jgi:dihydropteroate synthase
MQYHQNIFITLSSDHALYLGRELMKAELALIISQQYIQA